MRNGHNTFTLPSFATWWQITNILNVGTYCRKEWSTRYLNELNLEKINDGSRFSKQWKYPSQNCTNINWCCAFSRNTHHIRNRKIFPKEAISSLNDPIYVNICCVKLKCLTNNVAQFIWIYCSTVVRTFLISPNCQYSLWGLTSSRHLGQYMSKIWIGKVTIKETSRCYKTSLLRTKEKNGESTVMKNPDERGVIIK